jgi:hypothetical protein
MPFLDCPSCRLTVRVRNTEALLGQDCPRCGDRLSGRPRSLFTPNLPLRLASRLESNRLDEESRQSRVG